MNIVLQGRQLNFIQIPLYFQNHGIVNLFASKNNKTLAETLKSRRYTGLSSETYRLYPNSLNTRLGIFLLDLKSNGDNFYLHFLNRYGDKVYCAFSIKSTSLSRSKGVYSFSIDNELKYLGRSHESFEKRLNQGYGHISPKNCFLDGQCTNCHLNSLIAQNYPSVSFYVFPLEDDSVINRLEKLLISSYKPAWNVQF